MTDTDNKLTIQEVDAMLEHAKQWGEPKDILQQLADVMRENERLRKALSDIYSEGEGRDPDASYMGMIAQEALQNKPTDKP